MADMEVAQDSCRVSVYKQVFSDRWLAHTMRGGFYFDSLRISSDLIWICRSLWWSLIFWTYVTKIFSALAYGSVEFEFFWFVMSWWGIQNRKQRLEVDKSSETLPTKPCLDLTTRWMTRIPWPRTSLWYLQYVVFEC